MVSRYAASGEFEALASMHHRAASRPAFRYARFGSFFGDLAMTDFPDISKVPNEIAIDLGRYPSR